MGDWLNNTHLGDCRVLMRRMIADGVKVQCIVTSPPYWGLRDYGTGTWDGGELECDHLEKTGGTGASTLGPESGGNYMTPEAMQRSIERSFVPYRQICRKCGAHRLDKQFGLERTWLRHVARMRGVFRLARELLAEDGLLWMNYGDSYANVGKWGGSTSGKHRRRLHGHNKLVRRKRDYSDLKPKDLVGMPWRVAFALQHDGWYLRSDVIWHKPNPMPESIKDRPTKSHEYVFMFAKSETYYYDQAAIREPSSADSHARASRGRLAGWHPPGQEAHNGLLAPRPGVHKKVSGWNMGEGSHSTLEHAKSRKDKGRHEQGLRHSDKFGRGAGWRNRQNASFSAAVAGLVDDRNARTVWTIPTEPFTGAHFATFPQDLVARCILVGSRPGDTILDIFHGSGTVGKVATDLGRNFIGLELNPEYVEMNEFRRTTTGMPI